jgi:large repetitive protein
MVNAV